jgi:hypothetical protein
VIVVHNEALGYLQELTSKPVFATALSQLDPGTELALRLDDRIEFALFWRDGKTYVEERTAQADVEISFSSEALRQLRHDPAEHLVPFGIALSEQILAGQMRVRVRGPFWRLATGGYWRIIVLGGPELAKALAHRGWRQANSWRR